MIRSFVSKNDARYLNTMLIKNRFVHFKHCHWGDNTIFLFVLNATQTKQFNYFSYRNPFCCNHSGPFSKGECLLCSKQLSGCRRLSFWSIFSVRGSELCKCSGKNATIKWSRFSVRNKELVMDGHSSVYLAIWLIVMYFNKVTTKCFDNSMTKVIKTSLDPSHQAWHFSPPQRNREMRASLYK